MVAHGTLCEGHVAFCIYEDNCIGPKMRENVALRIKKKKLQHRLRDGTSAEDNL